MDISAIPATHDHCMNSLGMSCRRDCQRPDFCGEFRTESLKASSVPVSAACLRLSNEYFQSPQQLRSASLQFSKCQSHPHKGGLGTTVPTFFMTCGGGGGITVPGKADAKKGTYSYGIPIHSKHVLCACSHGQP